MTTIYEALAEPVRRRILDLLCERPRLVGELAELLGISQPGVSKHLRVLREVGLARARWDTQRRWPRSMTGWRPTAIYGKQDFSIWTIF